MMKVEENDYGFKPVTITLETQDELNWLIACLGKTSVRDLNAVEAAWNSLVYRQTNADWEARGGLIYKE